VAGQTESRLRAIGDDGAEVVRVIANMSRRPTDFPPNGVCLIAPRELLQLRERSLYSRTALAERLRRADALVCHSRSECYGLERGPRALRCWLVRAASTSL
jgi:hypothetical protein